MEAEPEESAALPADSRDGLRACWEMRDKGMCTRGDSCRYLHDPRAMAEARALRRRIPKHQTRAVMVVQPVSGSACPEEAGAEIRD
eukprot:7674999-Alexandrium_andersonii.AAC.1